MTTTGTYSLINSTTLSTGSNSIVFSNIPQTFTDLVLVTSLRRDNAGVAGYVQANGDSGNNYSTTYVWGVGTGAVSARDLNRPFFDVIGAAGSSSNASTFAVSVNNFLDYSNSTTFKTAIGKTGYNNTASAWDYVQMHVSLWRNTSAITQLAVITASAATFVAGSTFKLYGIEAGNQ